MGLYKWSYLIFLRMGVCKTRNFLGFSGIVALGSFGLSDRVSIFGEYISSSIKTCSLVSSVSYTTNKIMFYLMTLTDILALKYDYDFLWANNVPQDHPSKPQPPYS